jgi:hypothetical protein
MIKIVKSIMLFAATMMIAVRSHAVVTLGDDLAAHYTFTGNFNDSSSSANNLDTRSSGSVLDVDRFGNINSSLRLGTTADYAQSSKNIGISGNGSHSVSVWIKSNYANNRWNTATILKYGDESQVAGVNALKIEYTSSGRLQMWGQYADWNAPNLFDTFKDWTQIVYTYNTDLFNSAFYINGNIVSSAVSGLYQSTLFNIVNTPLIIGKYGPGDGGYEDYGSGLPNGLVDDVRIYNRALSGSEVQQLFAIESVPEPSALSLLAVGLCGFAILRRRRS